MLHSIHRVFISFLLLYACAVTAGEQVAQGDIAPNWILADVDGRESSLYDGAEQNKWTVMVFCASWCSKCEKLLPQVQQLSQNADPASAAFYLMNVWESKDPAALEQQKSFNLPVMQHAEHVARRYGIGVTPGVVVVGPDKRIHYLREPGDDIPQVASKLKQILVTDSSE